MHAWWIILIVGTIAAILLFAWRSVHATLREARFAKVRRNFHGQREHLEAKFIRLASARSKSRFPRWEDCDFDDDVAYVRNRTTGELCAFVEVTVATAGSVEAPFGSLRAGTAVFRFDRTRWETDGKAFLNLSPTEAIRVFQNDLEMVEQELAHKTW